MKSKAFKQFLMRILETYAQTHEAELTVRAGIVRIMFKDDSSVDFTYPQAYDHYGNPRG